MDRNQLRRSFGILLLSTEHLSDALKGEVGLVQSRRRRKLDECFGKFELLPSCLNGGDVPLSVTKMECKPLNQKHPFDSTNAQPQSSVNNDEGPQKQDMERMLKGLCAKNNLNIIHMEGPVRQHHGGGATGGHGREGHHSSVRNVSFHPTSSQGGGANNSNVHQGASGGSGGGEKRPPRKPSHHHHSSDDDMTSTGADTTTSSISTSTSTSILSHGGRKRTLQSHSHNNLHGKRSKTDSNSLHIRTYGATGKPEQKSFAIDKSVDAHQRNPFPKGHPEILIKRRPSAASSTRRLSFAKGEWKAGQLDSPEESPEDSSNPAAKKKKKKVEKLHRLGRTITTRRESIHHEIQTERESEWLQYSSSESSFDEDEEETAGEKKKRKTKIKRDIQQDLRLFLDSTWVLDKFNTILGLNPYRKIERGNQSVQVKWVPKSREFLGVCVNCCVFFMTALSIFYTLIIIFTYDEGPQSTTDSVLKLEFANHFTEALFMLIIALFLSIWSVSCVMELGVHYAGFFTRFNLGVVLLKYDVTEGVHAMIVKQLAIVGGFLAGLAAFFFGGRDQIEIVREMCGFIGFCVLRPFNFGLRETIYYPLCEVFGLAIFSYCFFCLNVVLLQFLVYAKALGNMAKTWNLRLAFALGEISERKGGKTRVLKKTIPLKKLQAEHLIIVSLFRNLGHVNAIVFNGFAFCVSLEIVLVIFLLFSIFTEASPPPNVSEKKYVGDDGGVELAVPLRLQELKGETIFEALILTLITMCGFWLFGGVLHNAADHLHIGIEFVRRHGLPLCNTSKERRFILSMMNSYSPKHTYWIGKSFKFNLEFLLGLLAFVIGVSMVTVEFSPERVAVEKLVSCDAAGKCTLLTIPRTAVHLAYEVAGILPPNQDGRKPHDPEIITTPPPPSVDPELEEKYLATYFLQKTPCTSFGSYPLRDSQLATICQANWPFLKELKMPTIYKPVKYSGYAYFGQVEEPFGDDPTIVPTKCQVAGGQTGYDFPYETTFGVAPAGPIVDCFGNEVKTDKSDFDDCGNPLIKTPNGMAQQVDPVLRPIITGDLPGVSKEGSILCCFEYPGFTGSGEQVKICNTPDATVFEAVCKFGKERERMRSWEHVWKHHGRILTRILYEKEEKSNQYFIKTNEKVIKECLCRLKDPQVDLASKEHCICTGMAILPCKYPAYFQRAELDDYALKCGSVRVPVLFKTNMDNSLVFRAEHIRYRPDCSGGEFTDPFFHDHSLNYANPCGSGGAQLNLVDCAGNKIVLGDENKDDCSNWRVQTPDTISGAMLPPKLVLKAFNYDEKEKKIVSTQSNRKAFLCCFEYTGQAFQSGDQMKYCNAPSLEVLNKDGWCKKVVDNNGRRNPGSFVDGAKYDQLHRKLELTVEYHRRGGRPNWLEEAGLNEKWVRCMCSNKIPEFGGAAEFEQARKACIPLIVSPRDLYKRRDPNFFDPFPKCPKSWPNFAKLGHITSPQVFTLENSVWEMPQRYQKTGDPSTTNKCYSDTSFEERFTNKGSPPLFDLDLKLLPSGKTDDCFNLPIPVPRNPEGALLKPQIRLVPEYTFHLQKYDGISSTEFQNSEWLHCCFHYSEPTVHPEQRKVCNIPNSAAVKKRCRSSTRTSVRRKHERELVRRLTIAEKGIGAHFQGNKVPPISSLTWGSKAEIAWKKCICESSSASRTDNENCEKQYLPSCLIPKGEINKDIVKAEDTFTSCLSSSPSWNGGRLRFPIIMEFRFDRDLKETFKKIELFQDIKTKMKVSCPSEQTEYIFGGNGLDLTDCYGDSLTSPVELDDCKNPRVASPIRADLKKRKFPELQLIAVDQLPGGGGDDRIFCCFNYAIAENDEQVKVCNMFSKTGIDRECKDRLSTEKEPNIRQTIEMLKMERVANPAADVLKSSVPFSDVRRMKWTKCICNRDLTAC